MICPNCKELNSHEFLNSENTESVLGSSQKSGVLHAVRDRNANGQAAEKELEPVAEALEIRTEDENKSFMCKAWYNDSPCNKHCGDTEDCLFYPKDL